MNVSKHAVNNLFHAVCFKVNGGFSWSARSTNKIWCDERTLMLRTFTEGTNICHHISDIVSSLLEIRFKNESRRVNKAPNKIASSYNVIKSCFFLFSRLLPQVHSFLCQRATEQNLVIRSKTKCFENAPTPNQSDVFTTVEHRTSKLFLINISQATDS